MTEDGADVPDAELYEDELAPEEFAAVEETGGRERVLAARRRMLMILGSLTVLALGMVVLGLASWWVALPPIALLGSYVLLLREARRMDAEQDLLRASALREAEREAVEQELLAAAARAEEERVRVEAERRSEQLERARVIDISGRVRDELYDQYADEERRAVGD